MQLTDQEHEWLADTPFGDSRTVTKDGVGYTCDRRFAWPVVQPRQMIYETPGHVPVMTTGGRWI